MILIFPILFGAICAATVSHRPVDLHQCSLVKFDLNDLDNALYMYKACSALSNNLTEPERHNYLSDLRNKMDVACLNLVIGCGVDVNNWIRNKRGTKEINTRKHKLFKIMNYLTDVPQMDNSGAGKIMLEEDMDERVRQGLIHTIQERVDNVHDKIAQRCSAFKRSPEVEVTEANVTGNPSEAKQCTTLTTITTCTPPSTTPCMTEYVVGNVGMVIIGLFVISAFLCFLSLLVCKICCLTDCSIAAIHMWNKPPKCEKPKKKKKKKQPCCD